MNAQIKVKYLTFGCKLNFSETSSLRDKLLKIGYLEALKGETAQICVVNSCAVTQEAEHKCRQALHRLHRENPDARIYIMGCYAELKADEIGKIPGVARVIKQSEKPLADRIIQDAEVQLPDTPQFAPSCSRGNRTRYFLKVQDGCNYFCTYCTIPFARGRSCNGSIASLVKQAENVAAEGGQEIVLTGVNIGDFGRTTGETFFDLIQALDKVEGIERYRISSIEPNLLTDDIIAFCAQSRAFMPHFHIPLQCGCDEVLKLMRRRYDTALFRHKIEKIKEVMPDAFIGVDVIVGMRGETEEYFEQAYAFIESLDIQQLHVFPYSERPGTKALEIPHVVTPQDKHARLQRLLELSEAKRLKFYGQYQGTVRPVLWEGQTGQGWTDNYIRVEKADKTEIHGITPVLLGPFNADQSCLTHNP